MDFHAQSGLEVMTRAECLRLLGTQRVGRLGFLLGDQPVVLPVNYGVENGVVVFRTGEGAKLEGARKGRVAFEVDDLDRDGCGGWSVVVQGVADDITGTEDWFAERLRAIAGPACLPGAADHYVRITPSQISGRRVPVKPRSRKVRAWCCLRGAPATLVTGFRAGAALAVGRRGGLSRVVLVNRLEQPLAPAAGAAGDVGLDR